MRKLVAPTDDARDVYSLCISRINKLSLRRRLRQVASDVDDAANAFLAAAEAPSFFQIPSAESIRGIVSVAEMVAVYDFRMAKRGSPGRPVYDRLMSAVPHMRCPLCAQRTISTLDHYLPKTRYPTLVVAPLNLVPACADCNKAKLARLAESAAEQTLHPYFDDVDVSSWLYSEVVEGTPAALRFFASPSVNLSEVARARIQHHFRTFGLASLYASHSAEELLNIRFGLAKLFGTAGAEGVRAHLLSEVESRSQVHGNSWQLAMYRALAASDWYCDGGFGL